MYVNNHTEVWGSWYDPSSGTWGYACCHSIIHVSYCSGEAGIQAAEASSAQNLLASAAAAGPSKAISYQPPPEDRQDASEKEKVLQNYSKKRVGEGDVEMDRARLSEAISEEKKRKMRGEESEDRSGKKRKNVPESGSHDVTEEELGMWFPSVAFLYDER